MSVFKKIIERLNKPVSVSAEPKRMRVKMRLTPSGWGFLGLIFCGFLMSVNFSNNLIFAMTFLLISIALVGWYHTRVNVKGLLLADWKAEPVFAGQRAVYRMGVENRGRMGRHGLTVRAKNSVDGDESHLADNEKKDMVLERTANERGILAPIQSLLCSSFPLGIFEARMTAGVLPECLVYPVPVGDQPIPEQSAGGLAHLQAESGTYTDMRRYSPGDPMSRISWKVFAKFDELYTKEFDGAQGQPALYLRWDDVYVSGTEQKLSQLCRWVLDAHKKNREFGLELPGTTIEPANEEPHLLDCLRALALFGKTEQKP